MTDIGRVESLLAARLKTRDGVKSLADFAGFDNTGATDCTVNWLAALSGGGRIEIPAGTYRINNADIPTNAGDVTLIPMGAVTVKWDSVNSTSAGTALRFNNTSNVTSAITVATVVDDNNYPASNDGPVTTITASAGTFSAFAKYDVCHIMSNETAQGFIKGEMFKVLDVAGDGSAIWCDRRLYYTYDAATYTTQVRRFTATPKLTILPGITFAPNQNVTTVVSRGYGIYLVGAVEPDIDVEFDGCYTVAIEARGIYGGRIRGRFRDMLVDYADNAFGYGVEVKGACYGTEIDVSGTRTGHLVTLNAQQTVYDAAAWWDAGTPSYGFSNARGRNCLRSPADTHWAIRWHFGTVECVDTVQDADSTADTDIGLSLGGLEVTVDNLVVRNALCAISLRDHLGATTTHTIGRIDYINHTKPYAARVVGNGASQTAGTDLTVDIQSGSVAMDGSTCYPLGTDSSSSDAGFRVVCRGVRFSRSGGLIRHNGTRDIRTDLHDCIYEPTAAGGQDRSVCRYGANVSSKVRIFGLDIIKNGSGYPDGLVRASSSGVTATTLVGRITVNTGSFPDLSPASTGGATITNTRFNTLGSVQTTAVTGGTGSAGAGAQYVEMTLNGTTYKVLHDGTV